MLFGPPNTHERTAFMNRRFLHHFIDVTAIFGLQAGLDTE